MVRHGPERVTFISLVSLNNLGGLVFSCANDEAANSKMISTMDTLNRELTSTIDAPVVPAMFSFIIDQPFEPA